MERELDHRSRSRAISPPPKLPRRRSRSRATSPPPRLPRLNPTKAISRLRRPPPTPTMAQGTRPTRTSLLVPAAPPPTPASPPTCSSPGSMSRDRMRPTTLSRRPCHHPTPATTTPTTWTITSTDDGSRRLLDQSTMTSHFRRRVLPHVLCPPPP